MYHRLPLDCVCSGLADVKVVCFETETLVVCDVCFEMEGITFYVGIYRSAFLERYFSELLMSFH